MVGFKLKKSLGNDLLSQEVTLQVPSALTALTTGFEMLPGVPLSLRSPRDFLIQKVKVERIVCVRSRVNFIQKSAEFSASQRKPSIISTA